MQHPKKSPKIDIWAQSHNFVVNRTTLLCYILATKARIDNQKKKLVKQQLAHTSSQYGEY